MGKGFFVTIPHYSTQLPAEICKQMVGSDNPEVELHRRLLGNGDPFTDQIFDLKNASRIFHASFSRFAVDLNRAPDALGKNGIVKSCDFNLSPLYPSNREPDSEEIQRRIEFYHRPWHDKLLSEIALLQPQFLIDGHSMSALGPALGPDHRRPRPAICLGNMGDENGEPFDSGTPITFSANKLRWLKEELLKEFAELFGETGFAQPLSLNQPFDGGYITQNCFTNANLQSLLFEINRDLYVDEENLTPLENRIERLNQGLIRVLSRLHDNWSQL